MNLKLIVFVISAHFPHHIISELSPKVEGMLTFSIESCQHKTKKEIKYAKYNKN